MKKLMLLCSVSLACFSLAAGQGAAPISHIQSGTHRWVTSAVLLGGDVYATSINAYKASDASASHLLKIDASDSVVGQLEFLQPDSTLLHSVSVYDDRLLLVAGVKYADPPANSHGAIRVMLIDPDGFLRVLDTLYDLGADSYDIQSVCVTSDRLVLLALAVVDSDTLQGANFDIGWLALDPGFAIANFTHIPNIQTPPPGYTYGTEMCRHIIPDRWGSGYYALAERYLATQSLQASDRTQVLRLDSAFGILGVANMAYPSSEYGVTIQNHSVAVPKRIVQLDSAHLAVSGWGQSPNPFPPGQYVPHGNYHIAYLVANTSTLSCEGYFPFEQSEPYDTAFMQGYATFEPDYSGEHIYWGGATNYSSVSALNFISAPVDQQVVVRKMRRDGSVLWTRAFGSHYNYFLAALLPTPQGGVVGVGTYYDWRASYPHSDHRHLFVLRLDSLGNPLGAPAALPEPPAGPLALRPWPNPLPQGQALQLHAPASGCVLDAQGRELARFRNTHLLPTHHLPPGLYTLRLAGGQHARFVVAE